MELIKEIFEKDVLSDHQAPKKVSYTLRRAARGLVIKKGQIAVLYVTQHNYHKLPGGGIEPEEDIQKALSREVLEETGCMCDVEKELGITIEYKDRVKILQISYVFLLKVRKESQASFTALEQSQGFRLEWLEKDNVRDIFAKDAPTDYHGKFISFRDQAILRYTNVSKSVILA